MRNPYGEMTTHSKYQNTLRKKRGSDRARAIMLKNLVRVTSSYGTRSNFKEIVTININ